MVEFALCGANKTKRDAAVGSVPFVDCRKTLVGASIARPFPFAL